MFQQLSLKNRLSKKHTQHFRHCLALNRNSAGFTRELKELTYTLVCDKAEGSHVWDLDENKYIDLTMGFGSILFGHNYLPLRNAIEEQLRITWSVGPISSLAGKLANEICLATGVERVAFFNSGTEAVMVALRIAKTVTKKNYIVYFKGSYHGTFDPLLTLKNDPVTNIAKEVVPGVTQSILNESYLLEYGSEQSLEFIKKNKDKIAAVLTEPVQSRNPGFQPVPFLKQLRQLTEESNIALVFDEVITGFRIHIGGCQRYFDIKADIVTYGKIIGGGLPIGIVAGKSKFLDATDGGYWQYEDDSFPSVKTTFVAGTFCHHPLAMAAALKVLKILNDGKNSLLSNLNTSTTNLCTVLNNDFKERGYPISVNHFGSLFRFITPGRSNMLYYQLLINGVYIWEGRNCFLSTAHDAEVLSSLQERIVLSCSQLVAQGFMKSNIQHETMLK